MVKRSNERASAWRHMGLALYVPIVLAVAPVAGYFLGQWIDGKFGTGQIFTWLCILLGFGVAARQIYHVVRRLQREQEEESSK